MSRCSSARCLAQRHALRGVHGCQTFGGLAEAGLKLRIPPAKVDFSGSQSACVRSPGRRARGWPLGVLFGNCWHTRHAAMAPFARSHPKNPRLSTRCRAVGFRRRCSRDTATLEAMDHVSRDATRLSRARQAQKPSRRLEGKRNPRDGGAGPDRLIPQRSAGEQPFWLGSSFLRADVQCGNNAANKPARVAQLDTAMIVLFWSGR